MIITYTPGGCFVDDDLNIYLTSYYYKSVRNQENAPNLPVPQAKTVSGLFSD